METQVYTPVKGSSMGRERAQRYGPELAAIEEENGILTPFAVIEKAEDEDSPLHDWFTWDDTAAARLYRREQARSMIRSIEIEVVIVKNEPMATRAWHHIEVVAVDEEGEEKPQRGYMGAERVFTDKDLTAQTIAKALGALRSFQRKFSSYSELSAALKHTQAAIDELAEQES